MKRNRLLRGIPLTLMVVVSGAGSAMAGSERPGSDSALEAASQGVQTDGSSVCTPGEHADCAAAGEALVVEVAAPGISFPADSSWINQVRPTITGTAPAGSTVKVYIDDVETGSTSVDAAGNWSFTLTNDLSSDSFSRTHTVSAEAVDVDGNVSPRSAVNTFNVDIIAPTTNFSTIFGDSTRRDYEYRFSGRDVESGMARLECSLNSPDFQPCASPLLLSNLPDARYTLRVRAVDNAGNVDLSPAINSWYVDTTPPETLIDRGPVGPKNTEIVIIYLDAVDTGVGQVGYDCRVDSGDFYDCETATPTFQLTEGAHTLWFRARDKLGNTDPTPISYGVVMDYTAPVPPSFSTPVEAQWVASQTPIISGTAEAGSTVEVRIGDTVVGTAPVNAEGKWSFTPSSAFKQGANALKATATDEAGNVSAESNARTFQVDTVAPTTKLESAPSLAPGSADITITFSANEEVTFLCTLSVDGGAGAPESCVSPFVRTGLATGKYTLVIQATDRAGNAAEAVSHSWEVKPVDESCGGCSSPVGDPASAMMALAGLAAYVSRRRRK